MSKYEQEPPFAVQVEFSEGCNLYCDFCGLQGIRTIKEKNFKFMTLETADSIASQIARAGWNPRVEFALHGEPTMNPEYIQLVGIFRKYLPKQQLMMTTNGGGFLRPPGVRDSLVELFDAGINLVAFDAYEYVKIKDKIDTVLFGANNDFPFEVHRYPEEKEWSPHNRYGHKARVFIRIQDISVAVKGTHSSLNNHCGAGAPPLKKPLQARCAKPFREISIRWDGNVAICCNSWEGNFKCGNVVRNGLLNVWHSAALDSARKFLVRGDRAALSPCRICDAKSYRVGLLPDKKGKIKLPEPTERDHAIVQAATAGPAYSEIVLRPWEIRRGKRGA